VVDNDTVTRISASSARTTISDLISATDSKIAFQRPAQKMVSKDPTTQSNYLDVYTTHISLDWLVDFEKKNISGSATHKLTVASSGVEEVM